MWLCDVVVTFLSFSFVSLKVKLVTDFNEPQKQIGECKHARIHHTHTHKLFKRARVVNKDRGDDCDLFQGFMKPR